MVEVCYHGRPVQREVVDGYCRSVLDEERLTLTLKVVAKLYVETETFVDVPNCAMRPDHDEDSTNLRLTYVGRTPKQSMIDMFKSRFIEAVACSWSGKLKLVDYVNGARVPQNILCNVEVEFTDDETRRDINLRVKAMFDPRLWIISGDPHYDWSYYEYRSNCYTGGILDASPTSPGFDMRAAWRYPDGGWDYHRQLPPEDVLERIPLQLEQNEIAHEFGHYLGHHHACHVPENVNVGWCESSDYCHGGTAHQLGSIMAVGNRVDPQHARPWWERLRMHHFYCWAPYTGATIP
jgi:hypothetical protein